MRLRGGAIEASLAPESDDEVSSEAYNQGIKGITPLDWVEQCCPSSQRLECTLTPAELFQVPIKYVVQNSKFTPANGTAFSDYQKRQVRSLPLQPYLPEWLLYLADIARDGFEQMLAVESRVQVVSQLHREFKKAAKANNSQRAIEVLCMFRKIWEDNKPRNCEDEMREYLSEKVANEWEILLIQTTQNPSMKRTFMQWMGE